MKRGIVNRPPADGHLAALLGGADADLLAAISVLALSGMRFDGLRRLRVAQCGRGAFRVGERRANDGPRAVPVHSALVRTTIRLTRERAGDAFLIRDDAEFGRAPAPMQLRSDACRIAIGVVGPSLSIHGLRRWFEGAALEAGQPPDDVATVVGHARSDDGRLRPEPT